MAKKKFHRYLFYYLLLGLQSVFLALPHRWGFWFGGSVGKLAFRSLPKERKKTLAHLRLAFGETKSEQELSKIGEKMFEHYGQIAAEWCLMEKMIPCIDDYVKITGLEHLDRALKAGGGVIAIISHIGNWEMLGGTLALKGYQGSVIARRIYFEKYNARLVALRSRFGEKTIYRDSSPREILKEFRQNRIVGFVVDQDVEGLDGVYAQFFGRPAFTPTAPVRFSLSTGAPMLPMFILRKGMRHEIIIEPPIEMTKTRDKQNDTLVNTQKWVTIQERYIRQYPELWVWNHKRWKTGQNDPI